MTAYAELKAEGRRVWRNAGYGGYGGMGGGMQGGDVEESVRNIWQVPAQRIQCNRNYIEI